MATALATEATRLNEGYGLTDSAIARATGAARSTARAWIAGTREPSGERAERLIELVAICERLELVMERDYIAIWLRKPIPALEDEKPLDLIARGDYLPVARVVSALEDPGAI